MTQNFPLVKYLYDLFRFPSRSQGDRRRLVSNQSLHNHFMTLVTVIDSRRTAVLTRTTTEEVPGRHDVVSQKEKSYYHTLPRAKLERKYNTLPPSVANLFVGGLQTSQTACGHFNPNFSEVAI